MLNYRAIARGFLVDLSATILFAAALTIVVLDPGSSAYCLAERFHNTNLIDWIAMLGGLTMTGLGAFVCGRMVPNREMTHASAVGCLSLLAALCIDGGAAAQVDWFSFTGLVLTVPVAQLGGALAALYTSVTGATAAE